MVQVYKVYIIASIPSVRKFLLIVLSSHCCKFCICFVRAFRFVTYDLHIMENCLFIYLSVHIPCTELSCDYIDIFSGDLHYSLENMILAAVVSIGAFVFLET